MKQPFEVTEKGEVRIVGVVIRDNALHQAIKTLRLRFGLWLQ